MVLRRLFLALPLLIAAPLLAQEIPADISGTYKVEGRNPDGSVYKGPLRTKGVKNGKIYSVRRVVFFILSIVATPTLS